MNKTGKIRIMHIITDIGKGGAERFLIDLCEEHSKNENIEFIIVSLFKDNAYKDLTKNFKIEYINYKMFSIRKPQENTEFISLVKEFDPHIIHTHRYLAEFLSAETVNKKIAYVTHGHDNMIQLKPFQMSSMGSKDSLLNLFEKNILFKRKYKKVKTYFIANSIDTENYYQKVFQKQKNVEVKLMPYGFDYKKFSKTEETRINKNELVRLVNVGSFQDKKNQKFIVKIAEELRSRGLNFQIELAGNGANLEKVKAEVAALKLEKHVKFLGLVDQVEKLMQSCHIYLHTAWYEPFGLVFLEAMAAGLPIVTLNGKGNEGLIKNDFNGFFIREEDAVIFADKIEYLINNKKAYQEISRNGKEFSKEYDIEKKAEDFLNFYQSIRKF